jgi:hypothetical protein
MSNEFEWATLLNQNYAWKQDLGLDIDTQISWVAETQSLNSDPMRTIEAKSPSVGIVLKWVTFVALDGHLISGAPYHLWSTQS